MPLLGVNRALPLFTAAWQVWDRRTLHANPARSRSSGVFVGHTEGVTHIDSKARASSRLPDVLAPASCLPCSLSEQLYISAAWQPGLLRPAACTLDVGSPSWTPARCPPAHLQGDGRYLISNAKDQTVKLWDLR